MSSVTGFGSLKYACAVAENEIQENMSSIYQNSRAPIKHVLEKKKLKQIKLPIKSLIIRKFF